MPTTKLNLPTITGNMSADVVRDFNALANAIDGKVGATSGIASLGTDGKIPSGQLPTMDYVPTSQKGVANGVATLGADGKVPASQINADADTVDGKHASGTLITNEKTNLVGAINEAFRFANDGKTNVANAVTLKGVSASPSDSFTTLATKIGQINTGKLWASGTVTSNPGIKTFSRYDGASTTLNYVSFNFANLPFIPSDINFVRSDKTVHPHTMWKKDNFIESGAYYANCEYSNIPFRVSYVNGVVDIPVCAANVLMKWIAYE